MGAWLGDVRMPWPPVSVREQRVAELRLMEKRRKSHVFLPQESILTVWMIIHSLIT